MDTHVAIKPKNLKGDVVGIAGYTNGVHNEHVNISPTKLADGPAGVRLSPVRENDATRYYATAWPIGTLLASTWDRQLVRQVGRAFGAEVKDFGIDFLLAPGMNIQRNPLNGRNFEYYSEDPIVAGDMGAAFVEGIQSNGVGATVKHFVANNSENNRRFVDEMIAPRTLREIYLRSYHIAVRDAHPWAVISSYNKINGVYNNANKDLLTSVLRDDWGYQGMVMSDWFAGNLDDPAPSLQAGNDLTEPGGENIYQGLYQAYQQGKLSEHTIDQSATRVVTEILKTPTAHNLPYPGVPQQMKQHAQLSREAATQGMVLLKNAGHALPIQTNAKVASFGVAQVNTYKGGTGSGDVNSAHIVNIADGLAQRFNVDRELQQFYSLYFNAHKQRTTGPLGDIGNSHLYRSDEPAISDALMQTYARHNDVALVTLERLAGE